MAVSLVYGHKCISSFRLTERRLISEKGPTLSVKAYVFDLTSYRCHLTHSPSATVTSFLVLEPNKHIPF